MSVIIFLTCNDQEECDTVLPVGAETISDARMEARVKGWDTTRVYDDDGNGWKTMDHCTAHLPTRITHHPARLADRVPPQDCPLGNACPAPKAPTGKAAVFHWCGHDQLGHRMANVLTRDGYETLHTLLEADPAYLLDLRGFGPACIKRWELFKEAEPVHAA